MTDETDQAKKEIIKTMEKQLRDLKWDISCRTMELARLEERQKIDKRKRQEICEVIRFLKED